MNIFSIIIIVVFWMTVFYTLSKIYQKFVVLLKPERAAELLDYKNIYNIVLNIQERMSQMALNLDALTAEVTRAQTVQASAVTLLKNLTTELEDISAKLAATPPPVAPEVIDTKPIDDLVAKLKDSTDALAGAVADSWDTKPVHEVVLNATDSTKPTISVILPEVLPEHVEVKTEQVVDTVDPTSSAPQIVVSVEPAPAPAPDVAVVTDTIATPEGQTDVTVSVPAEVHAEVADHGIDVIEAVKEAVAEAEVPAEPAKPVEDNAADTVEGAPA